MTESQKMYLGTTPLNITYLGDLGVVSRYNAIDPDVRAFLDVTGITNTTIENALEDLVGTMKTDGVWSKLLAIYPFVGGTATTNKYNLKDPQDTNGAYRIDFQSNFTFASTGVTGDGTGPARTFLNPSTDLSQNSFSVAMYSRTNSDSTAYDFGATDGSSGISVQSKNSSTFSVRGATSSEITQSNNTSAGWFSVKRTTSGVFQFQPQQYGLGGFFNSTALSTTLPNEELYFGGLSSSNYSTREYAWLSIGDGLTNDEITNLGDAVIQFQTDLSRNV